MKILQMKISNYNKNYNKIKLNLIVNWHQKKQICKINYQNPNNKNLKN